MPSIPEHSAPVAAGAVVAGSASVGSGVPSAGASGAGSQRRKASPAASTTSADASENKRQKKWDASAKNLALRRSLGGKFKTIVDSTKKLLTKFTDTDTKCTPDEKAEYPEEFHNAASRCKLAYTYFNTDITDEHVESDELPKLVEGC